MQRLLLLAFLFLAAGLGQLATAQTGAAGLPPRPSPFRFVNDQAQLLQPADAKQLEGGLRRYADNTGTQVVVVTVPNLGGRDVADYGQALGTAWGVGQRNKNNGIVVLLSAKEHKVTIQPASGLAGTITPAVTSRIIAEMTPSFKQGNYFQGLRTGLNTLMLTANPSSNPNKNQPSAASNTTATDNPSAASGMSSNLNENNTPEPVQTPVSAPELDSSGFGFGTIVIGILVIGGGLWLIMKLFRGRSSATSNTPDFFPNRPNGPAGGYGQAPNNYGGGYGQAPNSGGIGVGGMLATGAAAAAGAYLGNRMASGHETSGNNLMDNDTNSSNLGAGAAAGAGAFGSNAAGDYFSSRDSGADNTAPDYFSTDNSSANSSSDYFSNDDNSSYDDTSSDDTGGGGFDSDNGSSGSW